MVNPETDPGGRKLRNPVRKLLLLASGAALLTGSSWAGVVGPVLPAGFSDSVDWCQFGCATATNSWLSLGASQTWLSAGGYTGSIALANAYPDGNLQLAVQDLNWAGNFASGMGLIYNNACCGSTPDEMLVAFDQAQFGAGVYIQANYPGDFTATVSLFDQSYQLLGSYSANGTSDQTAGNALFIGANSTGPVWFAQFSAIGTGGAGAEPDFAIGTMLLNSAASCTGDGSSDDSGGDSCASSDDNIPEPASLLLMSPALLGLVAFTRRRASDPRQSS
jgi:hypothetical protein